MMAGGLVAWFLAVDAEGKSLEDIATPLAAAGASRRTGSVRAEGEAGPTCPEPSPCGAQALVCACPPPTTSGRET